MKLAVICQGVSRGTVLQHGPRDNDAGRGREMPRNRGAQIRTGDLTDPNGARYQAAPRPEIAVESSSAPREQPSAEPRHPRPLPSAPPPAAHAAAATG